MNQSSSKIVSVRSISDRQLSLYEEKVMAEAFDLSGRKDKFFESVVTAIDECIPSNIEQIRTYVEALDLLFCEIPRLEREFEMSLEIDSDEHVLDLAARFRSKLAKVSYAVLPPPNSPKNRYLGAISISDSIVFLAEDVVIEPVSRTVTAFHEYIHLIAGARNYKGKKDRGFSVSLNGRSRLSDARTALNEGYTELAAINYYLNSNKYGNFDYLNVSGYNKYVSILRFLQAYFLQVDPVLVSEKRIDGVEYYRAFTLEQLLKIAYFENTNCPRQITYDGQHFENYFDLLQYFLDSHFGVDGFLAMLSSHMGRHYREMQRRKNNSINNADPNPHSLHPLKDATVELVETRDVPKFLQAVKI